MLLALSLALSLTTNAASANWRFAVSGDSRNCGDVVVPAIAAGVKASGALFYWHLGDFRWLTHPDEDYAHDAVRGARPPVQEQYHAAAWQDFINAQIKPFTPIPVILTIGNHELYGYTRKDYIGTFQRWLKPIDGVTHTYFHWTERAVAFISLDNASHDQFDAEQLAWLEKTLAGVAADPTIKSVVVGMHAALPDSISYGHSMSEPSKTGDAVGVDSGRKVYAALLDVRARTHKNIYVLASHSHFFMDGAYNTPYWRSHGGVLPGWIVGTAGAIRYQLPAEAKNAKKAETKVYGYLLATVNGESGKIRFDFVRTTRKEVPPATALRYGDELMRFCYEKNFLDLPITSQEH